MEPLFPDNLVDLKIELWRKSDSKKSIHEYLGWTIRDYEFWKDTGKTPWIESIYSISAVSLIGSRSMEKAVDAIFNRVKYLKESEQYSTIDRLFDSINIDRLEEYLLVAFLMCSLDSREKCLSWNRLFDRTQKASTARMKAEKELDKIWK